MRNTGDFDQAVSMWHNWPFPRVANPICLIALQELEISNYYSVTLMTFEGLCGSLIPILGGVHGNWRTFH